jgi:tetratricopeptide (TPR) repeat protein
LKQQKYLEYFVFWCPDEVISKNYLKTIFSKIQSVKWDENDFNIIITYLQKYGLIEVKNDDELTINNRTIIIVNKILCPQNDIKAIYSFIKNELDKNINDGILNHAVSICSYFEKLNKQCYKEYICKLEYKIAREYKKRLLINKANEFINQAIDIIEEYPPDNKSIHSRIYRFAATIYIEKKKYRKAKKFCDKAICIDRFLYNNDNYNHDILEDFLCSYIEQIKLSILSEENEETVKQQINEASALVKQKASLYFSFLFYYDTANAFWQAQKKEYAICYYNKALKNQCKMTVQESGKIVPYLLRTYYNLADLYYERKDYDDALKYICIAKKESCLILNNIDTDFSSIFLKSYMSQCEKLNKKINNIRKITV